VRVSPKKGAGLGSAITFLFVAPAVNILALSYTGTVIGLDIDRNDHRLMANLTR
jgi:uncharacterized membrane protein YraQ (UPF0718 family)